jgi:UDP-N-acetylmuramoylalanine--D-glutamate ligase
MYDFKADIAILLNITPDHLDRYDYKFQNYVDAKFRITRNQTSDDAFIYWAEDPVIDREMKKIQLGATLYPYGFTQPNPLPVGEDELALKGRHNVLNSMAATIAANVVGIQKEVIRESLKTFQGVEHRLQYVATVRGVRWINDSKATNVNSCWYALESMTTPTVLILGGKDKGNDYSEIDELVKEKCHTLIFMGLHNEKLHEHFGKLADSQKSKNESPIQIIDTNNLHDAVQAAYHAAHEGDTVLLSPCCASFDLFKSYEDRGEQFMAAVKAL